jgi:hypothetical protein
MQFSLLEFRKLLSLLNFGLDVKFYFYRLRSDEVRTSLKYPETINDNIEIEVKL